MSQAAIDPSLPAALADGGTMDLAELCPALREHLEAVGAAVDRAFASGVPATRLVAIRAALVDAVVVRLWHACMGASEDISLLAVGGLGRREIFPGSDADLLVLCHAPPAVSLRAGLEQFFACLWDVGLKPGQAVRDVAQCRTMAAADLSIHTGLLDARWLAGERHQCGRFMDDIRSDGNWPPARFLAARRESQRLRHRRFDDTAFKLEPQIKDGPGGLRDLNLLRWLPRVLGVDLLAADERRDAEAARAALFHTRYHLHLLAGRAEERLLFDYQRALALASGHPRPAQGNADVECFMQGHFNAVRCISDLNAALLDRADEYLEGSQPEQSLGAGLVRIGTRVGFHGAADLAGRPELLIDLFDAAAVAGAHGLRAQAVSQVRAFLADSGGALATPPVLERFGRLLGQPHAVAAVDALARHGVLAHLVPAFGRIRGRMQYDLFHAWTVDEHILRVLRVMDGFGQGGGSSLEHQVHSRLSEPRLLLLAGLFHDIGKGQGGDHSIVGEHEARAFCQRLRLPDADAELVAWLVRWHLLMSATAQRKDITDAWVIQRFAEAVGDLRRLDHLYLLTVADIRATNPNLWNAWKAQLLADLYRAAAYVLQRGIGGPPVVGDRLQRCRTRALAMLRRQGFCDKAIIACWADFPDAVFLRHRAEQVAWQTRSILEAGDGAAVVAVRSRGARAASEIFVHCADRDGLFATMTAELEHLGVGIVEARVLTTPAGHAYDSFLVLDGDGQPLAADQTGRVHDALVAALAAGGSQPDVRRRAVPRRVRHFHAAAQVEFTDAGDGLVRLRLECSDRPGLLAVVAYALWRCDVRVHDARIATFGERVEDYFVVSRADGRPFDEPFRAVVERVLVEHVDALFDTVRSGGTK